VRRVRKAINVYPREDRMGIYGFRLEVLLVDEVTLDGELSVRLVEDASSDISLADAERVGDLLKRLIEDTEKKMETSKSSLNSIIETVKKVASEMGYEVRFIREDDP
jgi:hypothetical protein